MTLRQSVLKWIYPLLMLFKKSHKEKGLILLNQHQQKPSRLFYTLKAITNHGKEIAMEEYRGKKILIVNVASDCGFTPQYDALEKLYQQHKELVVLGFPSNDFKNQETGSDQQIEQFCKVNFGVSFPLFKKQSVTGKERSEIYHWLTDKSWNGWNDQQPVWNFSKYLVDEQGTLQAVYGPAVPPLDIEV